MPQFNGMLVSFFENSLYQQKYQQLGGMSRVFREPHGKIKRPKAMILLSVGPLWTFKKL
jgi:hypothetical protein